MTSRFISLPLLGLSVGSTCLVFGAIAETTAPRAMIRGGADVSGQNYSWTVTNDSASPIVRVEFPHYRGSVFNPPDGWDTSESTYLVGVGVEDRPGICVGKAVKEAGGVLRGKPAEFRLQLTAGGARRALGNVTIQFADGASEIVSGVELPQRESFIDRYITLVGLGAIFGAWLLVRALRSRSALTTRSS